MRGERRFTKGATVRAKSGDNPGLTGYAAVFNEEYVLYEDSGLRFVETINPGAFKRALKEKQDVRCLFNHDPDNILGRTTNGTLRMSEDKQGLSYDADLDDRTRIAADVRCFVDRGDVTGCSFAFSVVKQSSRTEKVDDGKMTIYTRVIEDVDLYDVGPVTYPAYEGTSVDARALWPSGLSAEMRSLIASGSGSLERLSAVLPDADIRAIQKLRDDGECGCSCDNCEDGDCANCTNENCDDQNCSGCPMQSDRQSKAWDEERDRLLTVLGLST